MIKTKQFDSFRDVGNPVTAARVYNHQKADELIFLDITASVEERSTLFDIIEEVSEECFMPFAVGGGIKSLEDITRLIQHGADKVIINSYAIENPEFIRQAAEKFGSSTIVVSIDVRQHRDGSYEVYTHRGQTAVGKDPVTVAKQMEAMGAGEIMITSINKEGTMEGLDLLLTKQVVEAISVPVIASGGVGELSDFQKGFEVAGASAVAAGSIFHFTDQSPIMTKNYLLNNNANVRK